MSRTVDACPAPRCHVKIDRRHVLCAECWARVPGELQDLVFETWRPDAPSEAHQRAIAAAVRSLDRPATD